MTMSNSSLIASFKEGGTKGSASNMFIDGDVLYSFGKHFPLLVRMKHWGKGCFLLNADPYSVTTRQHQGLCFRTATVSVAFSCLQGALNNYRAYHNYEKIHLIDKEGERWDHIGWWQGNSGTTRKALTDKERDTLPEQEREGCYERTERRPEGAVLRIGRRYYLSSMDGNNYFFTWLPHRCETVNEAFVDLTPTWALYKEHKRQGEWFFIPTDRKFPSKAVKKWNWLRSRVIKEWHHKARDMVILSKDKIFARGTVRHANGDHKMLNLGEQWHHAVESNHKGSWGVQGRVD